RQSFCHSDEPRGLGITLRPCSNKPMALMSSVVGGDQFTNRLIAIALIVGNSAPEAKPHLSKQIWRFGSRRLADVFSFAVRLVTLNGSMTDDTAASGRLHRGK